MASEDEVRAASDRFYAALNRMANGDPAPMVAVWANSPRATAQHPIGGRELGSAAVIASFAGVAALAQGGHVALVGQQIDATADMAVETGVETGAVTLAGHKVTIEQRVTNVYLRQDGVWKIQHHHTDMSAAMLDVLARLPAPG